MSRFDDKYKKHSLFITSRLSTWIQLSVPGLQIVIGKSIRNACFGTVKHDWTSMIGHRLLGSELIGNIFYLCVAICNIWNSKLVFYNKTPCMLSCGCFNRHIRVVTSVKYYMSMIKENYWIHCKYYDRLRRWSV